MTASLFNQVQSKLDRLDVITDDTVARIIRDTMVSQENFAHLSLSERQMRFEKIFNALRRYDILQPLLEDETVTEIMVNGMENIFIERQGKLVKTSLKFTQRERLDYLVQKMVSAIDRTVNTANPIVDARLRDGSRVNIVLPPIALNGPIITIRKFGKKNFTFDDLIHLDAITKEASIFLKKCIHARLNIFISGGTGSGKTTFLNLLSQFICPNQRVITIEDSAELKLNSIPNWVRLETRNANTERVGEVTIKQLIKTALRMRPDRIIVGEVRGDEALDMLQAMNTGHSGSLSTGHANSVLDMLKRLETMVYAAKNMPLESIRQQIASAIDIVIHLSRMKDASRKVVSIQVLVGVEVNGYALIPLYQLQTSPANGSLLKSTGRQLPIGIRQKLKKIEEH